MGERAHANRKWTWAPYKIGEQKTIIDVNNNNNNKKETNLARVTLINFTIVSFTRSD